MISNDWKKNIILSTSAPDIWDVENPDKNLEWGNLVHFVLSRINSFEDLTLVIENLRDEGILDTSEVENLFNVMNELFSDLTIAQFFKPGLTIKNEAEIIMPEGFSYRPDRIIIDGKSATVVDYKTGKKEEKHRTQINKYARILKEMGYEDVRRYLLYIDMEDKVEEVRD